MKKMSVIMMALVLMVAMTLSACTGAGVGGAGKPTPEELLAMNDQVGDNFAASVRYPMSISVEMLGMTIGMDMDMDCDISCDGEKIYAEGSITMEAEGFSQPQTYKMYMDAEGGNAWIQMDLLGDTWYSMSVEDAAAQIGSSNMNQSAQMPADPAAYENVSVEEVNGEYVLSADLKAGAFSDMLAGSLGDTAGTDIENIVKAFDGVRMSGELHYDKESKMPKSYVVKVLDPIVITQEAEGLQMVMTIDQYEMYTELTQIGGVEVTIPAEVTENAVDYNTLYEGLDDLEDLDLED